MADYCARCRSGRCSGRSSSPFTPDRYESTPTGGIRLAGWSGNPRRRNASRGGGDGLGDLLLIGALGLAAYFLFRPSTALAGTTVGGGGSGVMTSGSGVQAGGVTSPGMPGNGAVLVPSTPYSGVTLLPATGGAGPAPIVTSPITGAVVATAPLLPTVVGSGGALLSGPAMAAGSAGLPSAVGAVGPVAGLVTGNVLGTGAGSTTAPDTLLPTGAADGSTPTDLSTALSSQPIMVYQDPGTGMISETYFPGAQLVDLNTIADLSDPGSLDLTMMPPPDADVDPSEFTDYFG